jgi:chromosome segregation ATPase
MTIAELHAERTTEAEELRHEIERLQAAINALSATVARANRDRRLADARVEDVEARIAANRILLDQALDLQAALQHRLGELERELTLERTVASIRGKLLRDITLTRWGTRRRAIERALRVERLIGR